VPPVQRLRGDTHAASLDGEASANLQPDAATSGGDRRVGAEGGIGSVPLALAKRVIGRRYPPAAVTAMLAIESAIVLGIGRVTEVISGIGAAGGEVGQHGFLIAVAAILFPVATILQGTFAARPPSIVAMWGTRLIAPLSVAQLVAIVAFASLSPDLPRGNSEAMALHWIGTWFILGYLTCGTLNSGFEVLVRRSEAHGPLTRRVVVFGGGRHGRRFIEALAREPVGGLEVEAFFDDRTKSIPGEIAGVPFAGTADELIAFVQSTPIDEIVIALPWSADGRILDILRKFRPLPMPVRLAPDSTLLYASLVGRATDDALVAPVIRPQPLSPWGLFIKEVIDRVLASLALLAFAPLLGAIAIAIKLDSPGPVFFRQPRLGFNNRPFRVYKFRTMRAAKSADATRRQATRSDPRVTRLGAFLRRWSLDELPQLINVLLGNMSLVGPRPHPMWRQAGELWAQNGNEPLEAIIHEYAARHRVKPGITGWAQISGFRGETSTVERMRNRIEFDIDYIDHWSLWFDFKIMALTIVTVFQTHDVY
jgi:polysaccharide biosynthesis protein PslA